MHAAEETGQRTPSLPSGWTVAALSGESAEAVVRLCVVVRRPCDPAEGHLVAVRRTFEAQVVLACIADAADRVQQWLELWIQQPPGFSGSDGTDRRALTNTALDRRWHRQAEARRVADEAGTVVTGWEVGHPPPTWIDRTTHTVVQGVDAESDQALALCRDDAMLSGRGLPPYSTSCHRYLCVPELGQQTPFMPLTSHAPTNEHTRSLEQVIGSRWADLVPLNPGGGLLMMQVYSPIGLEAFADVLAGHRRVAVRPGLVELGFDGVLEPVSAKPSTGVNGDGRLFLERHGRWGRLLESYHLKVKLLSDAVSAVRSVVGHTKRPVLNLRPAGFGIRLGAAGCGLPYLWTAVLVLADSGDAVDLPLNTDAGQFFRRIDREVSIYQPRSASAPTRGVAVVRLRAVEAPTDDTLLVEGTFATDERIETQPGDLAWLRLGVGDQTVDLYARLESEQALAAGEWRFRATNQRFSADQIKGLVAAKGVPLSETSFEIIPHRSTPCDLYALAVLAVRVLCVNQAKSLPETLDEVLSLARQVAQEHDASVSLEQRIANVFDSDSRWLASLGPHRLIAEPMEPEDAFDAIPPGLWWQTLAVVIKMLPGIGPDSTCRGWGDALSGQIHRVFDPAVTGFEALLLQSWSLVVVDWKFNREVHMVARSCLAQLAGQRDGR